MFAQICGQNTDGSFPDEVPDNDAEKKSTGREARLREQASTQEAATSGREVVQSCASAFF